MKWTIAGAILVCCVGIASMSIGEPAVSDPTQLKLQLMKITQVVAVTNFLGSSDKFVPDNDPDTLQIVFLTKPEYGPSRVSDDGEVIFLSPGTTDNEQSNLIGKAFDLRVQRRLSAQKAN